MLHHFLKAEGKFYSDMHVETDLDRNNFISFKESLACSSAINRGLFSMFG